MSADHNEPLALGTVFRINLSALSNKQSPYTVEQLITALEATTTLQELAVEVGIPFHLTAGNSRRIVAPLCRCIANLRHQNKHHLLQKLELCEAWLPENSDQDGMYLDVFEQFLVAAKRFGISHLTLQTVSPLPIQFLLEFCRNNSHLRVLEMNNATFTESRAAVSWSPTAVSWSPNDRSHISSAVLHLDKLTLDSVNFTSSTVAASYYNFFAHFSVAVMVLDNLQDDDAWDMACHNIVSEFK